MLSEEMLLGLDTIDSETTVVELLAIAQNHNQGDLDYHDTWGYLADAAFLASYHGKPKAFKQIVETIGTVLGSFLTVESYCLADGQTVMNEFARAAVLICSDAPTDPQIVAYTLGHLKGVLRMFRKTYVEVLNKEQQASVGCSMKARLRERMVRA